MLMLQTSLIPCLAVDAGKYTVPVFWDKKTKTIVNNECVSSHEQMFYPHGCDTSMHISASVLGSSHNRGLASAPDTAPERGLADLTTLPPGHPRLCAS